MVVHLAILLEFALVQAACYHRNILRLDGGNGAVGGAVRILHAHIPRIAVEAFADNVHVAAQADGSALAAAFAQHGHDVVGDVAFGDAAQIDHGLGVGQGNRCSLYGNGAVVNVRNRLGNGSVFGFHAVDEVPQRGNRTDGDVEKAV